MRMSSQVGRVALVVGLVACTDATAKDTANPPAELLVAISVPPDGTLGNVRAFANEIRPGAGAAMTQAVIYRGLAGISTAAALEGLDETAATYVLVVDGGPQLKGAVVVGRVRDEKALVSGLGGAFSAISDGWAVIGPEAIVNNVGRYAFSTLPSRPPVTSPIAMIYVPSVLKRYRTEIEAGRKQLISQMAATQGSTEMVEMMQGYVDGLYSALSDSERLLVTLDVTKDVGAIDLAMTPRAGSRLAKFVATQHPSDYALLSKLPATQAPMMIAGHIESGPYRQGMLDMFAMMYGRSGAKDLISTMGSIMKASTGDIAMVMQMGAGKPMRITQLFGVTAPKTVDRSIDHLLELFRSGRTFDSMNVRTTLKTNAERVEHDGVSLKGYDVTYDYSAAPAATRATMEKMIPGGTTTARVATFDQLGLVTIGGADAATAIDAARGKGDHFTPPPVIADFLTGSRARKESVAMVMDFASLLGTPGPSRTMMLSSGFADRSMHLRITMPTATVRAISGQP